MPDDELLTTDEAWRYLGVSRATFFNVLKRHPLPRYRKPLDAKRIYFKRVDLDLLKEPVREDPREVSAAA